MQMYIIWKDIQIAMQRDRMLMRDKCTVKSCMINISISGLRVTQIHVENCDLSCYIVL